MGLGLALHQLSLVLALVHHHMLPPFLGPDVTRKFAVACNMGYVDVPVLTSSYALSCVLPPVSNPDGPMCHVMPLVSRHSVAYSPVHFATFERMPLHSPNYPLAVPSFLPPPSSWRVIWHHVQCCAVPLCLCLSTLAPWRCNVTIAPRVKCFTSHTLAF